jgi:hypothetical protein
MVDMARFRTSGSTRRLALALLLPLLLIAQQGAFVHALQHLPGSASTASTSKSQKDVHPADDQFCDKCFAFAQIGAAAASAAPQAFVGAEAFQAIGFRSPIASTPEARIPRSRGPPSFL